MEINCNGVILLFIRFLLTLFALFGVVSCDGRGVSQITQETSNVSSSYAASSVTFNSSMRSASSVSSILSGSDYSSSMEGHSSSSSNGFDFEALNEDAKRLLTTRWSLVAYGYQTAELNDLIDNTSSALSFGDDVKVYAGEVGYAYGRSDGCNIQAGGFDIDGNTLLLKGGWTTLIFCPSSDALKEQNGFIDSVLFSTSSFFIDDSSLTLTSEDGKQLVYAEVK